MQAALHAPAAAGELFHKAIDRDVMGNLDLVPPCGSNGALYVRRFMVGSGHQLGLGPSDAYTFVVVVAPVGSYYKTKGLTPIPRIVSRSTTGLLP